MTKKNLFWLMLALSIVTTASITTSCGGGKDKPEEETPTNPAVSTVLTDSVTPADSATIDAGVIINGVKWATRNVDEPGKFAATAESTGKFFQWNRKTAWSAESKTVENWDTTVPKGTEWAAANDPSPAGWRVPALAEIQKLCDTEKVTEEWTTQNGVKGRLFTDKSTNNTLFLPAAGYHYSSNGDLYNVGTFGYYWSSTQGDGIYAYRLVFGSIYAGWTNGTRRYGQSLRPVAE
ncbi:MAG: fibrobacter succinogenes major paralogous domain-containing protein [Prevotellaceae bacterium]|jgi:uncharacterized protein (TIGR02145 family)|nr:fibrobacter succinogenes major paralogous domain-containing protein [Prevotellaceae bacterium]